MGDLMGTIETFFRALFGDDIDARFLPSFFPFTEPSAELATSCPFCHRRAAGCARRPDGSSSAAAGWSTPTCFAPSAIDPEEYSGFAFGFGIDRIALLRNGVDDIKAAVGQRHPLPPPVLSAP